ERTARKCLQDAWNDAQTMLPAEQRANIDTEIARQQIDTFLEFYAAWYPWDGTDTAYPEARREVELLLAGRKALREFKQPQKLTRENARPKSPLDPSRDSVVLAPHPCAGPPLRLKADEWLDATSLLKRVRGQSVRGQVPSTSDIAARTLEQQLE